MRVLRGFLLLPIVLGLVSCGDSAPILNAVGSYSDVAILTDLNLFNGIAYQLERDLEVDANTGIRTEAMFNADVFDMRDKKDARLYKNVIIVGYAKGRDAASREIQRHLAGEKMKVLESGNVLFADREDIYANNQNVVFLAGYDRSYMQSALRDEASLLRGQLEEKNRERVMEYLVSLGRNAEAERTLRDQLDIRMTVPEGYRINGMKRNESGDLGMVEVVHENPTRGVVIFWKKVDDLADFDLEDPQLLLALRRQWAVFLDEAIQDLYGHQWSAEFYRGESRPQLAGMYEIPDANIGGPFRTIFMKHPASGRIYGVNLFTYNPNGDKHPYLREVRAIADTFVPRS